MSIMSSSKVSGWKGTGTFGEVKGPPKTLDSATVKEIYKEMPNLSDSEFEKKYGYVSLYNSLSFYP